MVLDMDVSKDNPRMYDYEFGRVEDALTEHGKFQISEGFSPEFRFDRSSVSVYVHVKLKGSRKKASEIWGRATNLTGAIDNLIDSLDHWAGAW